MSSWLYNTDNEVVYQIVEMKTVMLINIYNDNIFL